jgi:hypothetical protein
MSVTVIDPRKKNATGQIDHLGAVADEGSNIRVGPDGTDSVALYGHCFRQAEITVNR